MAILNQRDYRTARSRISQLEQSISVQGVITGIVDHLPANVVRARQDTLKAELARLRADVIAYEALLEKSASTDHSIDVDDLGYLPILARISRGYSQRDLAEILEIKEQQVQRYESERYSGISLARYQKILDALGIELHPKLVPNHGKNLETTKSNIAIQPELLREILKRNWIDLSGNSTNESEKLVSYFIEQSLKANVGRPLFRKPVNPKREANKVSLQAWHARIAQLAQRSKGRLKGRFNLAETGWLKQLVPLSVYPDGPLRAIELLRDRGIQVVFEPVLPGGSLDGAAIRLPDGIPVIGLSLRHDRVDNFWFTLLHELGHIFLHYNSGLSEGFFDDLDSDSESKEETDADSFAQSQLIPDELWRSSPARFSKTDDLIREFAKSISIHPAIVAGRIRRERSNYKIFDNITGRGEIRRLFESSSMR